MTMGEDYSLRIVSEGVQQKVSSVREKNEITKSYSLVFVHTSYLLILLHHWLLVMLLLRELSKENT